MTEAELAKNLLVKNTLKAYQVDIVGEISIFEHPEIVLSMDSFEPVEYLKFSISIILKNKTFAVIKKGVCRVFTNWHLENQDFIRDGDFYIWGDYKIYKDELIKGFINNYSFDEEQDFTNPFNPTKRLYATADIILRCLEPIAKTIIPNLKSLYVTQDEQVC